MSGEELGDFPENALTPLNWYLLPRKVAMERLMSLQPSGDTIRTGIVLNEQQVEEIYTDDHIRLSAPIEYLFDQQGRYLFNKTEFTDPFNEVRDPGVIIAGTLIDFLTLLDTEKITYSEQMKLIKDSMNWLEDDVSCYHEGLSFHQVLGHFFGRAIVCGTYETDPFMNTTEAREFVSGYAIACTASERELFEKGYKNGVFRAMQDYDLIELLPIRGDNARVIGFDLN